MIATDGNPALVAAEIAKRAGFDVNPERVEAMRRYCEQPVYRPCGCRKCRGR